MIVENRILLSGGFDPIHSGHIQMIREATAFGKVVIALNSDAWLLRKKGYIFLDWEQRKQILIAIEGVDEVIPVDDFDNSVNSALTELKPNYFGNGGDRLLSNIPESEQDSLDLCIPEFTKHQIICNKKTLLIETQYGVCNEDDITRLDKEYL